MIVHLIYSASPAQFLAQRRQAAPHLIEYRMALALVDVLRGKKVTNYLSDGHHCERRPMLQILKCGDRNVRLRRYEIG